MDDYMGNRSTKKNKLMSETQKVTISYFSQKLVWNRLHQRTSTQTASSDWGLSNQMEWHAGKVNTQQWLKIFFLPNLVAFFKKENQSYGDFKF